MFRRSIKYRAARSIIGVEGKFYHRRRSRRRAVDVNKRGRNQHVG